MYTLLLLCIEGLGVCAVSVLQVGPKGKVIGIDHIQDLVDDSVTNLKKDDPSLISSGRVKLIGWFRNYTLLLNSVLPFASK